MQKRRQRWMGTVVVIVGLAGCQCCPLTDHYASVIDSIADHEHGLDVLYHPGLDLTRIGRPDWCHCGVNRLWCPCRCHGRKPLPHIVDTTAASYVGMHDPWNNSTRSQPLESVPADAPLPDDAESQPQEEALGGTHRPPCLGDDW